MYFVLSKSEINLYELYKKMCSHNISIERDPLTGIEYMIHQIKDKNNSKITIATLLITSEQKLFNLTIENSNLEKMFGKIPQKMYHVCTV